MIQIAIVGAGSIGLGLAAYFGRGGAKVRLWSRGFQDTLAPHAITSTGGVEWKGEVSASSDVASVIGGADVVFLCLPGNGQKAGVDLVVPHLAAGMTVVASSQYSLSALYLSRRLHEAGVSGVTIIGLATTMLTARRVDRNTVNVLTVRDRYGFGLFPPEQAASAAQLLNQLTGKTPDQVSMTEIVFANPNPLAHAPNALCNLTRIEKGEEWSNYGMMTETVCALIEALDSERIEAARRFGVDPISLNTHVHNSFGTPLGTMAEMSAHITANRGGPKGPVSLSSRYIVEDIPYGLLPVAELGERAGVPMPIHRAFITLFSSACRTDFAEGNDLLPALGLDALGSDVLKDVLANGWSSVAQASQQTS